MRQLNKKSQKLNSLIKNYWICRLKFKTKRQSNYKTYNNYKKKSIKLEMTFKDQKPKMNNYNKELASFNKNNLKWNKTYKKKSNS